MSNCLFWCIMSLKRLCAIKSQITHQPTIVLICVAARVLFCEFLVFLTHGHSTFTPPPATFIASLAPAEKKTLNKTYREAHLCSKDLVSPSELSLLGCEIVWEFQEAWFYAIETKMIFVWIQYMLIPCWCSLLTVGYANDTWVYIFSTYSDYVKQINNVDNYT